MSRPEITKNLAKALEKRLDPHNDPRIYWAKEVTFDYATGNAVRVDYMSFAPINNSVSGIEKGDFYCYEIKSSVADFLSKNGHNFIGDFNYYVMPEDVADSVKNRIPYNVGILVPDEWGGLRMLKKARRKDRNRPTPEMLLMMWRSSRREVVKIKRSENSIVKVETSFYDKEEIHENCTVQVLTNTATGEVSVGWWKNGGVDNG